MSKARIVAVVRERMVTQDQCRHVCRSAQDVPDLSSSCEVLQAEQSRLIESLALLRSLVNYRSRLRLVMRVATVGDERRDAV
jgi:hypothetical protein